MSNPVIVVPIGDPAGIGPEIVVKALARAEVQNAARVVVIGDRNIIQRALTITGTALTIRAITEPSEGDFVRGNINLIALDNIDMAHFETGIVSGMCGKAAYEYIEKSIALALTRKADAVATTPINKESLKAGGVPFIGHTEIFGKLTGVDDPLTMFETRGLRVFFLSRHVSLRKACDMVTKERIVDYVKRSVSVLKKLGVYTGTMAIAGLNPHSGEHGLFGDEEVNEVFPAVKELQEAGYMVAGPIGADSVFHLALKGVYNSVLSLYHDQGHIATKTLDFDRTISITGGMPILRTSVDHGTAFDIAGKNIASEVSMVEAILLAAKYSPSFAGNANIGNV
ncbi:MAG: 4-hydroxythreonine-4-phosphate dehydrogenase PdxA [Spirochaetaceae bacterium]|jgi:4-hydroxythreonine-4-phosphate dehydrogenase|nr:4-hydroxythreonine-4-phosphate dehydrogenase PdxA [Spirochaetaceae bacterium]